MSASPAWRVVVSAFLAWNLVAIIAATLPGTPSPLRARLIAATRASLRFTGLWQAWDMFAPYPQSFTADAQAVVSHADGQQSTWRIPGPEQVRSGKLGVDRWRKWRDAVRSDAHWAIWADTARLAARRKADPSNPPVRVELVRRWGDVPPPRPGDRQPREFPEPLNEATYFRYEVRAPDLAR